MNKIIVIMLAMVVAIPSLIADEVSELRNEVQQLKAQVQMLVEHQAAAKAIEANAIRLENQALSDMEARGSFFPLRGSLLDETL